MRWSSGSESHDLSITPGSTRVWPLESASDLILVWKVKEGCGNWHFKEGPQVTRMQGTRVHTEKSFFSHGLLSPEFPHKLSDPSGTHFLPESTCHRD